MTSLALATHATRAATPPLNCTFYATIATIVPVMFLTLRRGEFVEATQSR